MPWGAVAGAVIGAGASIYSADKQADAQEDAYDQGQIPGERQAQSEYFSGLGGGDFMRQYDPEYFGGQTYSDVPEYYQNAMQDYAASGSDPNSATGLSEQYSKDVLGGDYLGLSPAMQNAVMNPAMDATASRFAQMGRYGSPASQSGMMQSGMEAMMPFYNAERGRQENAAGRLPGFDDTRFNRFGPLAGSDMGQQQLGIDEEMNRWNFDQNDYLNRMTQFGNLLGVNGGYNPPPGPVAGDPLAAGLGGALAGYSAASGWGSGFGGGSTSPYSFGGAGGAQPTGYNSGVGGTGGSAYNTSGGDWGGTASGGQGWQSLWGPNAGNANNWG